MKPISPFSQHLIDGEWRQLTPEEFETKYPNYNQNPNFQQSYQHVPTTSQQGPKGLGPRQNEWAQGGGGFSQHPLIALGLGGYQGGQGQQQILGGPRGQPFTGNPMEPPPSNPIPQWGSEVMKGFGKFGEQLGGYKEQMGGFGEQLGGFGEQLGGFKGQFENIDSRLQNMEKGITSLTDKMGVQQQPQNPFQMYGGYNPYGSGYGGYSFFQDGGEVEKPGIMDRIKGFFQQRKESQPRMEGGDNPEYMKIFNFLWEKGFSEPQIRAIMNGEVNQEDIVPERMQMDENMNFSVPQEPFTGAKGGIVGYKDGGYILFKGSMNPKSPMMATEDKLKELSSIGYKQGKDYDIVSLKILEDALGKKEGGIVDVLESLRPRMAGGGIMDYTRGGHAVGPGTATSDSIPAFLSDGEFVMTNKAVKGFGGGNREQGAQKLYSMMKKAEAGA